MRLAKIEADTKAALAANAAAAAKAKADEDAAFAMAEQERAAREKAASAAKLKADAEAAKEEADAMKAKQEADQAEAKAKALEKEAAQANAIDKMNAELELAKQKRAMEIEQTIAEEKEESSRLKLHMMLPSKRLREQELKLLRLLLTSKLLRLLRSPRPRLPLRRPSKRSSDLLPRRKPRELPLRTPERRSKSDKQFKRPLLNKLDSRLSRMSKMPSRQLLMLKSKEERMRRRLPSRLLRLRDSDLKS